ncbi:MAG: AAA domain-containing protein [Candidatus Pacebacteria bacterium]|nr:AAA domain-containing protein [Candidatus Paceibacterota bacterium]
MENELILGRYRLNKNLSPPAEALWPELDINWYEGTDEGSKRKVRVKVCNLPFGEPAIEQILRALWNDEVRKYHRILFAGRTPNLINFIDAGYDTKHKAYALVTDLPPKLTLEQVLFARDQLRQQRPTEFYIGYNQFHELKLLAESILLLHKSGLIHRNINPSHIYYVEELQGMQPGWLKIGDFEWSIYVQNFHTQHYLSLNSRNNIYRSPEQLAFLALSKNSVDIGEGFAIDIYSLGLLFFVCLIRFFTKEEIDSFISDSYSPKQHRKWLNKIQDEIRSSNELDDKEKFLLIKMIASDLQNRFSSMNQVIDKLEEIVKDRKVIESGPVKSRKRFLVQLTNSLQEQINYNYPEEMQDSMQLWLHEKFENFVKNDLEYANVIVSEVTTRKCIYLIGKQYIYIGIPSKEESWEAFHTLVLVGLSSNAPSVPSDQRITLIEQIDAKFRTRYTDQYEYSLWSYLLSKGDINQIRTDQREFVESMRVLATAEKQTWFEDVYAFEIVNKIYQPPTDPQGFHKEQVTLKAKELEHPLSHYFMSSGQGRTLIEFIQQLVEQGRVSVELTGFHNNPFLDEMGRFEIVADSIDLDAGEFDVSRILKADKNANDLWKDAPQMGFIRPWDLAYQFPLYKRKILAIDDLDRSSYLVDILLGKVRVFKAIESGEISLKDEKLDKSKQEILSDILNIYPLYLVQGPPGTGKTTLLTELIFQILRGKKGDPTARILVASQSHDPLDHLLEEVEKKLDHNEKELLFGTDIEHISVRLGAREGSSYEQFHSIPIARKVINETLSRLPSNRESKISQNFLSIWEAWLKNNSENPDQRFVRRIENSANITYVTSNSKALANLDQKDFDWVIIEEAAKAMPTDLLICLSSGRRFVLVGDHRQLPPYRYEDYKRGMEKFLHPDSEVKNELKYLEELDEPELKSFAQTCINQMTIFANLYTIYERYGAAKALKTQYRMHPKIRQLVGECFYPTYNLNDGIKHSDRIHKLTSPKEIKGKPIIWYDIPRKQENMERRVEGGGFYNPVEVKLISNILNLMAVEISCKEKYTLAILSPYKAQVHALKKTITPIWDNLKLAPFIFGIAEFATVDSFQGREADIVIISFVRNNPNTSLLLSLGFCSSEERLNVLFSRTKRLLIIVGCRELFDSDKPLEVVNTLNKLGY